MIKLFVSLLLSFGLVLCIGCPGNEDDDDVAAEGCDACAEDEVCMSYLGGEADYEACDAIPADCGAEAACAEQDCISSLYGLCDDGWIGVGCSDTFPPTLVSCNPE